jgi:hypothetical protein
MSETNNSKVDPVVEALSIEKDLDATLKDESEAKARKGVREKMEKWLMIMEKRGVKKQYAEELGDLDPRRAQYEMLVAIQQRFPQVAKELGLDEKLMAEFTRVAEEDAAVEPVQDEVAKKPSKKSAAAKNMAA